MTIRIATARVAADTVTENVLRLFGLRADEAHAVCQRPLPDLEAWVSPIRCVINRRKCRGVTVGQSRAASGFGCPLTTKWCTPGTAGAIAWPDYSTGTASA